MNKTADKKLWDKEIQREMAEHRERHFANREVEIKKYEQDLQIWKDVNRKYIGACYCLPILFNLQAKIFKIFYICNISNMVTDNSIWVLFQCEASDV